MRNLESLWKRRPVEQQLTVVVVMLFQVEASRTQLQSGSLKFSSSGSSWATTDNFNQSLHLPPAAPVHVDPSTASPARFLERGVGARYSQERLAGRDVEDGAWEKWMSSHHSHEHAQSARGPLLVVPFLGELVLCSR